MKQFLTLSLSSVWLCAGQNLNPYTEHLTRTLIDDFVFSSKSTSQVSSITSTMTFEKLYHTGTVEKPEA